jgi:hypothetical protein
VNLELSEDEAASLDRAIGTLNLFVKQTGRGWSHPAVDPAWCSAAALRLVCLAQGEEPADDDHLTVYRVAATIGGCEPFGMDVTIRDLIAVATRLAPLPNIAPLGTRSRPSPLGDE